MKIGAIYESFKAALKGYVLVNSFKKSQKPLF